MLMPPSCFQRHRARGFTLMELLITMALIAIVLTLSVPSFREALVRNDASSLANDLVVSLAQARAEALKRGTFVAVVSRSGDGDWTSGWEVRADAARDSTFSELLSSHGAATQGFQLRSFATDARPQRAVFTAQGTLASVVAGGVNAFELNVCRPDGNAAKSRRIQVQASGETSTRRGTEGSLAPSCTGS